MLRGLVTCCIAVLVGTGSLLAADQGGAAVKFKVSDATAVPGTTLQPGSYSIQVVDHLSDRYIVRVKNARGESLVNFIGVPTPSIKKPSAPGMLRWSGTASDKTYVRGWYFADLPAVLEFAYPKAEAVAIAKANQSQVPAIDPESEGKVSGPGLSKDDMQMVTLWLLTPTHVGPGDTSGGIKAQRLQQVAAVHKPVIASLPHTASLLPWLWLFGSASLLGAFSLRTTRLLAARGK
jgi:hypothetical protein